MLKQIKIFMILILFIAVLNGCGGSSLNIPVTLNFSGFPCGYISYNLSEFYMIVYVWKNNTAEKIYRLGFIPTNKSSTQMINISKDSTDISVFLVDPNFFEEPDFFYQFSIKSGVNVYSTDYWLSYYEYFHQGDIRFGISPMFSQDITSNYSTNIDFNIAPYYLYKVIDVTSKKISGTITASEGRFEFHYDDTIDKIAKSSSGARSIDSFQTFDQQYNPLYILIRPENYINSTKATFNLNGTYYINGPEKNILEMIPSNNPNIVYALEGDSHGCSLLYIDLANKVIKNTYSLPGLYFDMCYSATDNKLYFADANYLTIWNLSTNDYTKINYSSAFNSIKTFEIEVASSLRRLYITGSDGLYIINLDTYSVINKNSTIFAPNDYNANGHYKIALDESHQKLYISTTLSVGANLWRYSINNDLITFEQSISYGLTSPGEIELSPDHSKLIYNPFKENTVWELNPLNFSKNNECTFNTLPIRVKFSSDGQYLYCSSTNKLYVINVSNYSIINELAPDNYISNFSTNIDDSLFTLCSGFSSFYLHIYFLNSSDINTPTLHSSMFRSCSVSSTIKKLITSGLKAYPNAALMPTHQ